MSFSLYLSCTRNGESAVFGRALFEEIMRPDAINPRSPLLSVNYADGSGCAEIRMAEDDEIERLSFSHFGPGFFFDRLWELAERTNSFFWWPGAERFVAVTNLEMLAHLPAGLPEGCEPYVVKNGSELYEAIFARDPDDS
jgi:hypothetical protein